MRNGEWGMVNGEWGNGRMGNGEWGNGGMGEWVMRNGEWDMGNGEWEMGNGKWGIGNKKERSEKRWREKSEESEKEEEGRERCCVCILCMVRCCCFINQPGQISYMNRNYSTILRKSYLKCADYMILWQGTDPI
jgi:hypothetical protein